MEPRRLVMVHDRVGPPTGMGKVVAAMVRAAHEADWQVVVVSAEVTVELPKPVDVVRVPALRRLPGLLEHFNWVRGARQAVERLGEAAVVHVHSPHLATVADVVTCHHLAEASYQYGSRANARGRNRVLRAAQHEVAWRLDARAYRQIDRSKLTFVSPFLASEFERLYGRLDRVIVLPPPTPDWNPSSDAERAQARDRFKVCGESLAVGFFGGVDPRKNLDIVLPIGDRAGIELLIAGHGTDLVTWPGRRGLGFVDPADVLAACDVVVVPSRFDAAPVIVPEAVARDRPVVVTSTNGWAAALAEFGAGLVWEQPEDLESVVRRASRLASHGRRAFTDAFRSTVLSERLIDVYEARVSRPG